MDCLFEYECFQCDSGTSKERKVVDERDGGRGLLKTGEQSCPEKASADQRTSERSTLERSSAHKVRCVGPFLY